MHFKLKILKLLLSQLILMCATVELGDSLGRLLLKMMGMCFKHGSEFSKIKKSNSSVIYYLHKSVQELLDLITHGSLISSRHVSWWIWKCPDSNWRLQSLHATSSSGIIQCLPKHTA